MHLYLSCIYCAYLYHVDVLAKPKSNVLFVYLTLNYQPYLLGWKFQHICQGTRGEIAKPSHSHCEHT